MVTRKKVAARCEAWGGVISVLNLKSGRAARRPESHLRACLLCYTMSPDMTVSVTRRTMVRVHARHASGDAGRSTASEQDARTVPWHPWWHHGGAACSRGSNSLCRRWQSSQSTIYGRKPYSWSCVHDNKYYFQRFQDSAIRKIHRAHYFRGHCPTSDRQDEVEDDRTQEWTLASRDER